MQQCGDHEQDLDGSCEGEQLVERQEGEGVLSLPLQLERLSLNKCVEYIAYVDLCHTHVPSGCNMDLPCHIYMCNRAEGFNEKEKRN